MAGRMYHQAPMPIYGQPKTWTWHNPQTQAHAPRYSTVPLFTPPAPPVLRPPPNPYAPEPPPEETTPEEPPKDDNGGGQPEAEAPPAVEPASEEPGEYAFVICESLCY